MEKKSKTNRNNYETLSVKDLLSPVDKWETKIGHKRKNQEEIKQNKNSSILFLMLFLIFILSNHCCWINSKIRRVFNNFKTTEYCKFQTVTWSSLTQNRVEHLDLFLWIKQIFQITVIVSVNNSILIHQMSVHLYIWLKRSSFWSNFNQLLRNCLTFASKDFKIISGAPALIRF